MSFLFHPLDIKPGAQIPGGKERKEKKRIKVNKLSIHLMLKGAGGEK